MWSQVYASAPHVRIMSTGAASTWSRKIHILGLTDIALQKQQDNGWESYMLCVAKSPWSLDQCGYSNVCRRIRRGGLARSMTSVE